MSSSNHSSAGRTRCLYHLFPLLLVLSDCLILPVQSFGKETSYSWLKELNATRQPTCLSSLGDCLNASFMCKLDADVLLRVCGNMWQFNWALNGCRRKNKKACVGAVFTLKTQAPSLKTCSCDSYSARPQSMEYKRCLKLWQTLNDHPCLRQPPTYLSPKEEARSYQEEERGGPPTPAPPPRINADVLDRLEDGGGGDSGPVVPLEPGNKGPSQLVPIEKSDPLSSMVRARLRGSLRILVHDLGMRPPVVPTRVHPQVSKTSCLKRQDSCYKSDRCRVEMRDFRTQCTFEKCESQSPLCLSVYDRFRLFEMFDCSCEMETEQGRRAKCVKYQAEFIDNKCLAMYNSRSLYETVPMWPDSTGESKDQVTYPKMKSDARGISGSSTRNCHAAYQTCLNDPQCPGLYTAIERACQHSPGSKIGAQSSTCPNPQRCQEAVASFYRQPRRFAYEAMACDCPPEDFTCIRQKEVFHARCAWQTGGRSGGVNCLHVMAQCVSNLTCLDTYSLYSEVCISAGEAGVCRFSPGQCLDVSRSIRDSVLMQHCTCDFGQSVQIASKGSIVIPHAICEGFQRSMQSPFCLKKTKVKAKSKEELDWQNACKIKIRHRLPTSNNIRIYIPATFLATPLRESRAGIGASSGGTMVCSRACTCEPDGRTYHCSDIPCPPPRKHSIYSDNQSDASGQKARGSGGSRSCSFVPNRGRECSCEDGLLTCRLFSESAKGLQFSQVSLVVTYDMDDHQLLSGRKLAWDVDRLAEALTTLLQSIAGGRHCFLSLHTQRGSQVTYRLGYRSSSGATGHPQTSGSSWRRPQSSGSSSLENQRWIKKCMNALQLVRVMIDRAYPEVRHNLPLSVLVSAGVKAPTESPPTPPNNPPNQSPVSRKLNPNSAARSSPDTPLSLLVAMFLLLTLSTSRFLS